MSHRFAVRKEKKTSAKEKKTSAIRKPRKKKIPTVPKGWEPGCWKDSDSDDDSQYGDSLLGEGEWTRPRKAPVSKKPADVRKAMW